jgi:hypothetical protein
MMHAREILQACFSDSRKIRIFLGAGLMVRKHVDLQSASENQNLHICHYHHHLIIIIVAVIINYKHKIVSSSQCNVSDTSKHFCVQSITRIMNVIKMY